MSVDPQAAEPILAVLSAEERAKFFPPDVCAAEAATLARISCVEPPAAVDWAAWLARRRPVVLLAAWSTPALPPTLPESLRYVCYLAGSTRKLIRREQLVGGLVVTNWGDSISRTVAEAALMHVLVALRQGAECHETLRRAGGWRPAGLETRSLFGRRVGIHGFGFVARELVRLLQPFGVSMATWAPGTADAVLDAAGVRRAASLEALFSESEVMVELAPLTPETTGCVNEGLLRRLAPGAVFVNLGRGAVVDEAALAQVAADCGLRVGLDVFAQEPLPPDSAWRTAPGVFLTPHVAGPTTDRYGDAGAFGLRNVARFLRGEPLHAVVTPEIFDHST